MFDSRPLENPADIERRHNRVQLRSLRRVLLFVGLLMLVMAVAEQVLSLPGDSKTYIYLAVAFMALLFHQLLLSQPRKWKSPLMVAFVLVVATWAAQRYGSVRTTSIFAFIGAVTMAGTYLSLRALGVTTGAGILLLGLLTWAESNGLLTQAMLLPDLRYWLMGSIIMVLIGMQLYFSSMSTDEEHVRHLRQMEERMWLEHERDQSERRFRRIFQLNPTALLVLSANNQAVVEVNPAFERCFGLKGGQIVGMTAVEFWVDEKQWHEHCRALFDHGHTGWQACQWKRPDGQAFDVLVSSELSEDPSGALILTTVVEHQGAT